MELKLSRVNVVKQGIEGCKSGDLEENVKMSENVMCV